MKKNKFDGKNGDFTINVTLKGKYVKEMPFSHIKASLESEWRELKSEALRYINREIKGNV